MAGLDAMLPTFSILPPHCVNPDPMEHTEIGEAIYMMYGPILSRWANTPHDPTGWLLRVLASVIYHFDWIQKIANTCTDHSFNSIPLMFCPDIVRALRKIISTNPSLVILLASRIPPHVAQCLKLQDILSGVTDCLHLLKIKVVNIKEVRVCTLVLIILLYPENGLLL